LIHEKNNYLDQLSNSAFYDSKIGGPGDKKKFQKLYGNFGRSRMEHTKRRSGVLEYERIVHTTSQVAFSVKGIYVFRYKYENISLNIGGSSYLNNESVSHMLLLGNAFFLQAGKKSIKGFTLIVAWV